MSIRKSRVADLIANTLTRETKCVADAQECG